MVFALRTVFGADYGKAILTVSCSWLAISAGSRVFAYIPPLFFSPFLLFYAFIYLRGEAGTIGQSFRNRQNFRRFLENATLNPNDADAHVQLGLLHLQRRQEKEAIERFKRALEIDGHELDANFQMGRIAREQGRLQEAIEHFGIVVQQNEKHSNSELWREIGATYLAANMLTEAREALEKYVERRPFDPEGLYYLGQVLSKLNNAQEAKEMFHRCVEAVDTMPYYRRGQLNKWRKLAQESL
jgi:tetratricopeptide (TPR) repeat protein